MSPEVEARTAHTFAPWGDVIPRLALMFIALCPILGCTLAEQMLPGQRAAVHRAEEVRDQNLRVMRFADEYTGRVTEAVQRFQNGTNRAEDRLGGQNWKVQQAGAAYTIASGPNPVTNSLDMVVLATLSRMVLDDLWVAERYGDRARPVQEAHRDLEAGAWQLASGSLTPAQITQLHAIIDRWRAENPDVRAVAYIHFRDLAKSLGNPPPGAERDLGNLWTMLGLDPLAQLNPAVREITQTRELAERTIFYMQRAPSLLDMQLERATYQLAVMPETKSLLADLDRASLIGPAADRLAASLPDLLAKQRQALLSQVMQEIDDRIATINSLSGEVRSTLQAGTETANALHATLETVDRIAARFPPDPHHAGTGVTDVTQMVRELGVTTRELNDLTQHVDTTLPAIRSETREVADNIERIQDRGFMQLLMLVLAVIAAALIAALVYRAASIRMDRLLRSRGHRAIGE